MAAINEPGRWTTVLKKFTGQTCEVEHADGAPHKVAIDRGWGRYTGIFTGPMAVYGVGLMITSLILIMKSSTLLGHGSLTLTTVQALFAAFIAAVFREIIVAVYKAYVMYRATSRNGVTLQVLSFACSLEPQWPPFNWSRIYVTDVLMFVLLSAIIFVPAGFTSFLATRDNTFCRSVTVIGVPVNMLAPGGCDDYGCEYLSYSFISVLWRTVVPTREAADVVSGGIGSVTYVPNVPDGFSDRSAAAITIESTGVPALRVLRNCRPENGWNNASESYNITMGPLGGTLELRGKYIAVNKTSVKIGLWINMRWNSGATTHECILTASFAEVEASWQFLNGGLVRTKILSARSINVDASSGNYKFDTSAHQVLEYLAYPLQSQLQLKVLHLLASTDVAGEEFDSLSTTLATVFALRLSTKDAFINQQVYKASNVTKNVCSTTYAESVYWAGLILAGLAIMFNFFTLTAWSGLIDFSVSQIIYLMRTLVGTNDLSRPSWMRVGESIDGLDERYQLRARRLAAAEVDLVMLPVAAEGDAVAAVELVPVQEVDQFMIPVVEEVAVAGDEDPVVKGVPVQVGDRFKAVEDVDLGKV